MNATQKKSKSYAGTVTTNVSEQAGIGVRGLMSGKLQTKSKSKK